MNSKRIPQVIVKEDLLQAIARIVPDDLKRHKTSPPELIAEARLRMAALKSDGLLDTFIIYEARIAEAWMRLQRRKHQLDFCDVVIAAGFPLFNGVSFASAGQGRTKRLKVTINTPRYVAKKWHPEWLCTYAAKSAQDLGCNPAFDRAHLHALWARQAFNGESVLDEVLPNSRQRTSSSEKSEAQVSTKASKGWVTLDFSSPKACELTSDDIAVLKTRILRQLRRIAGTSPDSGYFVFFGDYLDRTLEQMALSSARLGLGLPRSLLGGISLTDSPFPDDVVRGLPSDMPFLLVTVLREMMKLRGAKFVSQWFQQKLVYPLSEDIVQALMAILRARDMVSQDEDGEFVPNPTMRYLGYKAAGTAFDPFTAAAAKAAYTCIEEKRHNYASAEFLAIPEFEVSTFAALVHRTRKNILELCTKSPAADVVVQVSLNLFPVTQEFRSGELESEDISSLLSEKRFAPSRTKLSQHLNLLETMRRKKGISRKDTELSTGDILDANDILFVALHCLEYYGAQSSKRGDSSTMIVACSQSTLELIREELEQLRIEFHRAGNDIKGRDQVYAWFTAIVPHSRP